MLNSIIKLALTHRLLTVVIFLAVLVQGTLTMLRLPIDVFPDLNRPRVTVLTEAHGMAPEEVETQITFPIESILNGAAGVTAVRSSSASGLSVVNIEFEWGTDIYVDRQVVTERLAAIKERLPAEVQPVLTPQSSIIGQIMHIGVWSETGATDDMQLRTYCDWVLRQRLLGVPGVAQVLVIGGGRKQMQVLVDPQALLNYDVTLQEVEEAVRNSNQNANGGYVIRGTNELLVRSIGRVQSTADMENIVVKPNRERPLLLQQVARVVEGPQMKRGDAGVNGHAAVMLTVSKQGSADTRGITLQVEKIIKELRANLPADIQINSQIYQQRGFIELSIRNVIEALRDGSLLVVIVLILFLQNVRTTLITLTAIPLSIVVTALVFRWLGESINTMTLGGLAVAIGELVDDAIVDVENIYRRLRENRQLAQPRPALQVIYEASSEVRSSIVFSTMLVVLVFVPLFALDGMEGRLFIPMAVAYIVSIIASLLVSLTVTPVLSYYLLARARAIEHSEDGWFVRKLKWVVGHAIRFSLRRPWQILSVVGVMVLISVGLLLQLGRDFLPPFNEGSVQVNSFLPPGSSLELSNRLGRELERKLLDVPGVVSVGRRTGRAELDEHAEGVNVSELIVTLDPQSHRSREAVLNDLRAAAATVPGLESSTEQPIQHAVSHMLSGVKAQIGIKIFGAELQTLRELAFKMREEIEGITGITDLMVEQQVEVPQLQVRLNREALAAQGLSVAVVNEALETAMNGRVVSEIVQAERKFDLILRLDERFRNDPDHLRRLAIPVPGRGNVPLFVLGNIVEATGPNTIHRERVQRRIILQCNTTGRDLSGIVADIQKRLTPVIAAMPAGYYVEFSGQFESQQSATRTIGLLSLASLAGMFLLLYSLFGSVSLALQVLSALPMAAIGAVAALILTGQTLTVASMVGFISLSGIASRNGILLLAHYVHLVKFEGEQFTPEMIERAGKERLSPMLMTALTAGIALVPLALSRGEPGREILYPMATVILGGLISSTLLDFFVHPALFLLFGKSSIERAVHPDESHATQLVDPLH